MPAQPSTHISLLDRLAHGRDSGAWADFHAAYGVLIHNFARRRNLRPEECDDVTQEVLLSLVKTLPGFRYDPAKGKFRSFLKTVTLRTIYQRTRRRRPELGQKQVEDAASPDEDAAAEAAWDAEWRQYHLRQALRAIEAEFGSKDCRIFRRYALEGCDARETAAAFETTVQKVYQIKSQILRRLSELIDAQIEEEG
jgi:RNA polymerase sigma-70 factor (ECF subfamily)